MKSLMNVRGRTVHKFHLFGQDNYRSRDLKTLYPHKSHNESRSDGIRVRIGMYKVVVRHLVTALTTKQNAVVFSYDVFFSFKFCRCENGHYCCFSFFSLIFMSALLRINKEIRATKPYSTFGPSRVRFGSLYYHNT